MRIVQYVVTDSLYKDISVSRITDIWCRTVINFRVATWLICTYAVQKVVLIGEGHQHPISFLCSFSKVHVMLHITVVDPAEWNPHPHSNWGEPEWAPLCEYNTEIWCLSWTSTFNQHSIYIYIHIVRCAVSHFRLLFCEFLRHSLFQKLARRHELSMTTVRTETTRGPTYSMARVIGATVWQKGFICRCYYLRCHSQ